MARDADALDQKVYPNLSEDFAHAGLDRDGYVESLKSELRTSPERIISDFGVYGGIRKDYYEAEVNVRLHYSGNEIPDDETEFPVYFQGYQEMTFYVSEHFGDVDSWMVDDFVTVSGKEKLYGGEDFDITISDGFFPDYTNFPSNGMVSLDGMLHLPLLAEGQRLTADFGIDVGDQRGHARMWNRPESYLYDWDLSNMRGSFVDVELTLPVDETPENYMIPKLLPMGVDSVNVNTRFVVTDENGRRVGLKGYNFTFPAENYSNMCYCSDLFGADVDGLWLLRVEDPQYAPFELLDVRRTGEQLYGVSLFPASRDEGMVGGWELTGRFLNEEVSLTADSPGGEVVYRALWQDGSLSGVIDYLTAESGAQTGFVGRKLGNRCVGLPKTALNGASLKIVIGEKQLACQTTRMGEKVRLTCGGEAFSGRMVRNVLVADDAAQVGLTLLLAFDDDTRGYAALLDKTTGQLGEGAFSVQ
ncbi:MAG TPA: hypothetical protein PKW95_12695 [bacterium]|nr:hypothetical protein [bacterium]